MARKQITPTKKERKVFEAVAEEAVFEAEFLALVMEHPHTPDQIKGAIRFLMIGAFDKLGTLMREKNPDGQMVRDIYPHACFAERGFYATFQIILKDLEETAPRVINSIQNHADRGEMPPRYPHPLTSLVPNCRLTLTDALKAKQKKGGGR